MDPVITEVEGFGVGGPDNADFAESPTYVFVGIMWISAGDLPRGGVPALTRVLLTLSSGLISVSGDPQSPHPSLS